MSKEYVIAPYGNTFAMYESNDFRLKRLNDIQSGKFVKTSEVKDIHNGYEIGIFKCDNGRQYIIFEDHTALQLIA